MLLGYHLTRLRTEVRPAFEGQKNISGLAGIGGNDQDTTNWGPPNLMFSSGIVGLGDGDSAFNRNRTDMGSVNLTTTYGAITSALAEIFAGRSSTNTHRKTLAEHLRSPGRRHRRAGVRRRRRLDQYGSALADFLLGIPDASSISFGNAGQVFQAVGL